MTKTIIIYNQPAQKLTNQDPTTGPVDLSSIGLSPTADLTALVSPDTFALVYDGHQWHSQTYMAWEALRINEALSVTRGHYSPETQAILTQFVASMDIKYQGQKSWVELLNELGTAIDALN
ncbi:hypothetical protein [Lacticaseibacillus camelliae]|nr:hypothetical protein [Lacticaseibacillus camelliae]